MGEPLNEYGLVGFPLGHSFSQKFFSEKFAAERINARYINFEVPEIGEILDVVTSHPKLRGFNVTIPYKEKIIALLSDISPQAKEIGAVNTVKVFREQSGDFRLVGYNTDIIGFMNSIRPYLAGGTHRMALVLGSGGASKAIVAGLKQLGIIPTIVSRSGGEGRLNYEQLTAEVMDAHTVIINTTPLGMWPNIATFPPIPYELLSPGHVCFDAVYNPDPTQFMVRSAERGATVVSGLEMLHLQAIAAWNIWISE